METVKEDKLTLPYDIGTRLLSDDEIEHLIYTTRMIHDGILPYDLMHKASCKIAEMLLIEDVKFESTLKYFDKIDIKKTIGTIEKLIDIYNQLPPTEIVHPLHEILRDEMYLKHGKKLEKQIYETIKKPLHQDCLTKQLESNVNILLDPLQKKTFRETTTYTRKGDELYNPVLIIDACLKELTVYDNPIAQETRQFKSVWESNLSRYPITLGPDTAPEISAQLSESGYIMKKREAEDIVKISFAVFIENHLAKIKSEIDTPGFYFELGKSKLHMVKYELPAEIKKEELQQGIKTLENFASHFENQKTALITVFKWGLISPFIFAMKQKGSWVKWPFLYGNGGTGKSTLGKMVLYLWGTPNNDTNMIPGSGFDNEARIGDRLKQFTFPIVVDEPGALFERKGPSEMIKTAIEKITSRGKYVGRRYRTIPAYAPVILTSNFRYPNDDAFNRRFYPILFSRSERKTEKERNQFDNEFMMENIQNCQLHDLKALGQFAAIEIMNDPKLLEMNWQELANTLIFRIYTDADLTPPEWIMTWSEIETMADLDDIHIENIRNFLVEEINKAFGQIQILDDEGRPTQRYDGKFDVKKSEDFKSRVWAVLNERKIPWALLGSDDTVYLTSGFLTALKKKECITESLVSLSDLLGWKYAKGKIKSAGFSGAHIRVNRIKFTKFVYPLCEDGGNCDE